MFPQGENKDELEAIILRLKHHDYAGYLSVRFSPLEQRVALSWLFGFFMDVEQISIKVNEPLLGEIRLQWWRDQLLKLQRGESVGHPVADGLAPYFKKSGDELFKELIGIVDSFGFEIQKEPVKMKTELQSILDQRYGGFFRAGLILTDGQFDNQDMVCSEAGKAFGVATLLAELNGFLHRDIMPLPQDIMSQHGLFHEDFLLEKVSSELSKDDGGSVGDKLPAKTKVLEDLLEGVMIGSWDIKAHMRKVPAKHKALFARWLLVPSLSALALRERRSGEAGISTLNPLKIFFTLYFKR